MSSAVVCFSPSLDAAPIGDAASASADRVAPLRHAHGAVIALWSRCPQALNIHSGCAWVTLGEGVEDSEGVRSGDLSVHAGQTLQVPAGVRAVVEAVRSMELCFVW